MNRNPLTNPTVAKRILRYSQLRDLPSHRLVCKMWMELTLVSWRRQVTLCIVQNDESLDCKKGLPLKSFKDFVQIETNQKTGKEQIQNDFKEKPFKNIKLKNWTMDHVFLGANIFPGFWNFIGATADTLIIERCKFVPTDLAFSRLLSNSNLKGISTLKLIKLFDNETEPQRDPGMREGLWQRWKRNPRWLRTTSPSKEFPPMGNVKSLRVVGRFPFTWCSFLRHFPNLEQFSCSGDHYYTNVLEIEIAYLKRNFNMELHKLKMLDLIHSHPLAMQVFCREKNVIQGFTLTDISIHLDRDYGTMEEFGNFLATPIVASLQKLHLYSNPRMDLYHTIPFRFIRESIAELSIWGNVIQSLEFLQFLPSLAKLYVKHYCREAAFFTSPYFRRGDRNRRLFSKIDIVQTAMKDPGMEGLKLNRMTFLHIDLLLADASVSRLCEWMPNLEEMKLSVRNRTLAKSLVDNAFEKPASIYSSPS